MIEISKKKGFEPFSKGLQKSLGKRTSLKMIKCLNNGILFNMENSIIVPQSVKVFIRMGKKKGNKVNELIGILKEYREKYTSIDLQKEARKWWMQSI